MRNASKGATVLRVALFADVHGNAWALEAVLQAMHEEKPDVILFLGDATLRVPAPGKTMALIRETTHQSVRGNYDWFVIGGFPGEKQRHIEEPFLPDEVAWTREQLTTADLDYLEAMPITIRLFAGTPQEIVAAHASPGRVFGGIFPHPDRHRWGTTDAAALDLLRGESARTIVCAHTHAVMDRRVGPYRIINPGSVSLGWNERDEMDALARWALMTWNGTEWHVAFRQQTYPVQAVWDAYEKWPLWPRLKQYPKPKWWGLQAARFAAAGEPMSCKS